MRKNDNNLWPCNKLKFLMLPEPKTQKQNTGDIQTLGLEKKRKEKKTQDYEHITPTN